MRPEKEVEERRELLQRFMDGDLPNEIQDTISQVKLKRILIKLEVLEWVLGK